MKSEVKVLFDTFSFKKKYDAHRKIKTPLSPQRDKGANLCGTTLFAGAKRSGHSGLPGNGGVRKGLLSFSPLLQGDLPRPSRPPRTKRRLSARLGGRYSSFSAHVSIYVPYLIRFFRGCQEEFWRSGGRILNKKGSRRVAPLRDPFFART